MRLGTLWAETLKPSPVNIKLPGWANSVHKSQSWIQSTISVKQTLHKYYQSRYFNWSTFPAPCRMLIVNITSLPIEHITSPHTIIRDTVNAFKFVDIDIIGRYIWWHIFIGFLISRFATNHEIHDVKWVYHT